LRDRVLRWRPVILAALHTLKFDFARARAMNERDAAFEHRLDEAVEVLAHGYRASSRPVSRRYASRYFARVRSITSAGSEGTGGCLFHLMSSR
jgi:hypothetical protein